MDTASLATWFLFGKLFGIATLVGFGEKRCRKNLPLYALDMVDFRSASPTDRFVVPAARDRLDAERHLILGDGHA